MRDNPIKLIFLNRKKEIDRTLMCFKELLTFWTDCKKNKIKSMDEIYVCFFFIWFTNLQRFTSPIHLLLPPLAGSQCRFTCFVFASQWRFTFQT